MTLQLQRTQQGVCHEVRLNLKKVDDVPFFVSSSRNNATVWMQGSLGLVALESY